MGSRTRRLVFLRLMAIVAICFMAIGHLLYSMTAGLDGYARLHMSVIAPSATSHKDLQDLMYHTQQGTQSRQRKMRQKKTSSNKDKIGCMDGKGGKGGKGDQCRLKFKGSDSEIIPKSGRHGSYSINPVEDPPWDIQRLPFKDISAMNAHIRTHNATLVHVRHCPQMHFQSAMADISKTSLRGSPWQPTERNSHSFVYSAFYDGRSSATTNRSRSLPSRGSIKVIGVRDLEQSRPPVYCQLWYPGEEDREDNSQEEGGVQGISRSPIVVPLKAYPLSNQTRSSRFQAFLYTCELPTRRPPLGVSLVTEACQHATNYLLIIQHTVASSEAKFSVCVSALEEGYSDTDGLLQMVEINRMFGADRFIFYNQTTGSEVSSHLKNYVDDNIAVVLPFNPPTSRSKHNPTLHTSHDWKEAMRFAGANDCLYRNMLNSGYLLFLDVDEMLVPRVYRKWVDMLDEQRMEVAVNRKQRKRYTYKPKPTTPLFQMPASVVLPAGIQGLVKESRNGPPLFYFKRVLFCSDCMDDEQFTTDQKVQELHLTALLKTERELVGPFKPTNLRYIVEPRQIKALASWGISSASGGKIRGFPVPDSKALVHVYNQIDKNSRHFRSQHPTVKDKVLLPYYDVILARILERHEKLENPFT